MSRTIPPAGLALLAAFAACAGPSLPPGTGRGVVAFDHAPPPGRPTFAAPTWRAGDRMVYVRGSTLRIGMHVEPGADGGYELVDDATGERQLLTSEFANVGHSDPDGRGGNVLLAAQAPADARYHWPLWPGKRWACHFLRKAPGQPPLPLLVTYTVEASEELTVPAGTFSTLRILRRATVAAEGTYLDRVSLYWYAPEAGVDVRRIDDSVMSELVELHRQ